MYATWYAICSHSADSACPDRQRQLFQILKQRFTAPAPLLTCRVINDEVTAHLKAHNFMHNTTLRLWVHWESLGGDRTRTILKCASNTLDSCDGGSDVDVLPAKHKASWEEYNEYRACCNVEIQKLRAAGGIAGASTVRRKLRMREYPPLYEYDFDSHTELHSLLKCKTPNVAPRKAEIVIDCSHYRRYVLSDLVHLRQTWKEMSTLNLEQVDNPLCLKLGLKLDPTLHFGNLGAAISDYCYRLKSMLRVHQESLAESKWKFEIGESVENEEILNWWQQTEDETEEW